MLFIPSPSGAIAPAFSTEIVERGRLTNLDNNQFIGFQYNPATFAYERKFNYGTVQWRGSEFGGDLAYLNSGPHTFDLNLDFVSEPPANRMEAQTDQPIPHPDLGVDFENLEATIKEWMLPIDGKRRPARINVVMGPRFFNGVVLSYRISISDYHGDLTARQARLELEFQEWEPTLNTQP